MTGLFAFGNISVNKNRERLEFEFLLSHLALVRPYLALF